jgi:hypothetical protein
MAYLVTVLLVLPIGHQVYGHRVHRKALRAVGLIPHGCPELPTRHEVRHAARSRPVRIAADAAWILDFILAVGLAIFSHSR